ncbi:hypothetical protein LCGC14_2581400 [marine sediment metagenome]|uniref:Uncharacterized protein n=1 Tax=marine sediment metagenome TaxID=412755 RepID=A0A0F9D730_9ZZZZ
MNDDVCTVEKCENFKSNGDELFCFHHRPNWRGACKLNGIEFIDVPSEDTNLLLTEFQGGKDGYEQFIQENTQKNTL